MAIPHGSKAVILLNGGDISSYLDDAVFSANVDQAETSTFGKQAKTYINGQKDGTLSLQGKYDGSANAIDAIISGLLGLGKEDQKFLYLPGGDGFGNLGKGLLGNLAKYEVHAPVKDVVSVAIEAQADGGGDPIAVLHAMAAEAATMNGTGLDGLAASTNGGVGYLHVSGITGAPNAVIKVQHSTDNITFTDLITFANVTGAGAQRIAVAGTVNRYVRAIVSSIAGASSVTFNVSFGRS